MMGHALRSGRRTAAVSVVRTLLVVSRPRFWIYLAGPFLVGFAAAAAGRESVTSAGFWLFLGYFLVPANLFLYGLNDLCDGDTDRFNSKKGTREHLTTVSDRRWLSPAVAVSVAVGLPLVVATPSVPARVFLMLFLVLGAFYSLPPLRFKARPVLDAASNVLYVMPAAVGYGAATDQWPSPVAFAGAACWTAAMHLISAIPDIEADRKAGLKTSAAVMGARVSLVACGILWSAAAAVLWYLISEPVGLIALAYPAIAAALFGRPEMVERVYWLFPSLNAVMGFVLFVWAAA